MRSVHIFWSLAEFLKKPTDDWLTSGSEDWILDCPRDDQEVAQFGELLATLSSQGHQIYITLYGGIHHACKENVSEETPSGWEMAMNQFVQFGSNNGILVDRGNSFWPEHANMWEADSWFKISESEKLVAKLIDRSVMRQK